MLKQSITIMVLLASLYIATAQQNIKYDYDNAGNRIKRYVVVLKSLSIPVEQDDTLAETIEQTNIETVINNDLLTEEPSVQSMEGSNYEIYPNPTKGMLIVKIVPFNNSQSNQLKVIDLMGKTILFLPILQETNYIDLTQQVAGSYYLIIQTPQEKKEWLIIKE